MTGPIARRAAECVFEGVRPGTYGIAAFHDENKNGEPETNGIGQPGEGVCISGRVDEIKDKPSFKKAKFTYNGGQLTRSARMRYLGPPPE